MAPAAGGEERARTRYKDRLAPLGVGSTRKAFAIGACERAILSAGLAIGKQSLNGHDERTCSAATPTSFECVPTVFARLAMGNRTSRSPEGCHEGHSGDPRFIKLAVLMACVFRAF